MAFEEKDISTMPTVSRVDGVTSIEIIQDKSISVGVKLRILAHKEVVIDGKSRGVRGSLPQETINAAWPGTAKTFKAHLFAIIDNIVWDD